MNGGGGSGIDDDDADDDDDEDDDDDNDEVVQGPFAFRKWFNSHQNYKSHSSAVTNQTQI